MVERTNAWYNTYKKLVWCTERRGRVIDFWVAFSNVIVIVSRLIRKVWTHYCWESRPTRKPLPIGAASKLLIVSHTSL